ncbi:MAG TPA: fibronectin type III domain-containing protein [Vicinamibacterales bacterium]
MGGPWKRHRLGKVDTTTTKRTAALVAFAATIALTFGAVAAASGGAATFYSFGSAGNGELGYDPSTISPGSINPVPTLVTISNSGGPLTAAAGPFHSAVVTATGELYTFGLNNFGQLGRPTATGNDYVPTQVVLPGATGGVIQVVVGYQSTFALTDTGQIFAFGLNSYGQLGTTTNATTLNPNQTPALVAMPPTMTGTVVRIAAGDYTVFAATSTGELYAWGRNDFYQLGHDNTFDSFTPDIPTTPYNPTPTLIALPGFSGTVAEIAAGSQHTLVLSSTSQLYGFGDNTSGELANLTAVPGFCCQFTLPAAMTIAGLTGSITHIGAGNVHSLVASSDGQLFAFGWNRYGELGNPTNMTTNNPNPVPALVTLPGLTGTITQLAGGYEDSLVVTSTGQLFTFGWNLSGQLGRTPITDNCLFTYYCDPAPALVSFPPGTQIASVAPGVSAQHTLAIPAIAATAPDAPTGVSAAAGNASATVSWTPPASDGGSAITGYTVTSVPGGLIGVGGANSTSAVVSGLTNGTSYTFTVTATNAVGTGPASAPSNSVTPATVPGPPTGVSAVAGNASATVSWTPPASNGGSAITGYTATSSPGGLTANAAANATSVVVSGLTNGTAYTFTVAAVNASGPSLPSAPSNSVTPAGVTTTTAIPASTTVVTGSLLGGNVANLAAADSSYFQVSSTTKGTRATAWYGTFNNVPTSLSSLTVTYSGLNSVACMQTIAIYKWSTKKWVTLDSRSVGSTQQLIANLVPSGALSNYVSATGQARVQVSCSASKSAFVSSGDLMEIIFIPGNPIK